ncbi:hypothetical protein MAQ5080_02038 [Marinomonas aquimarina]|uniref:Uncharacterized protein n=1 Tax=Marinomonas aquimarina TaxID=295068 RepID=A0A1A8THV1_9GAMM|nr:hypothetical protein [Marinomonas aquimarina]SBS31688.1 hypothetical protein MAQ5080_02038 [Marinomonas aquimarina]
MLLPVYILLASLCAVVVNKRLRIDPFVVILPCALLVVHDLDSLRSLFASLIPVVLLFAVLTLLRHRASLQVEAITRLGAGLSLGGFIGVQLIFLLPFTFAWLLALLVVLSFANIALLRFRGWPLMKIPAGLKLLLGMLIGALQFVSLGAGLALLQERYTAESLGNRSALWAFSLVGALIGLLALPGDLVWQALSVTSMLAAVIGGFIGVLLLQRLTLSAYESKVLDWIVLAMCVSVWGHLLLKHLVFSS